MSEEGETTGLHDDESSSLEEAPPAIEVKAAPMVEVAGGTRKRNAKKQRVEIFDRPFGPCSRAPFPHQQQPVLGWSMGFQPTGGGDAVQRR